MVAGVVMTLGVGAIAGVVSLTLTSAGQAFLMEQALRRIEGILNGEITVSGLRSPGLHRGVRLLGLRLAAPDGSSLLAVDSVDAEYSLRTILSDELAFAGVTLWRPRLTITKQARISHSIWRPSCTAMGRRAQELGAGVGPPRLR